MGIPMVEAPCRHCEGSGRVLVFDREALRRARVEAGLPQGAIARAGGWNQAVVSELESGSRALTAASAERYWRALEIASGRASPPPAPIPEEAAAGVP